MARNSGGAGSKKRATSKGKKRLTRDELLERLAPRTEEYQLPDEAGGGTIVLRGLSGSQAFDELKGIEGESDLERVKRLLLLGIKEPELALEDLNALGESSAGLLEDIGNHINKLSGFSMPGLDAFLALIQQQKESSSTASKS